MGTGRLRASSSAAIAILFVATLFVPYAVGQDSLQWYVEPKTDAAREVQDLFNLTFWIAMGVFVFVEALLIYVIWRFRKNKTTPAGETERGHTRAEIVWTIIPAIILLFLGTVSAQTLLKLDTVPDDTDFTIRVEAFQFGWSYVYPDGTREFAKPLRVEEGSKIRLEVVSRDVIHAVWIPEFALKLDAVPGRTNLQWFIAPEPGTYFLQCAEYCGVGHHSMHSSVEVFAKGSQPNPWGPPPACMDGRDNDRDGLTDFPADPGCESPEDTDEKDPVPEPAPGG